MEEMILEFTYEIEKRLIYAAAGLSSTHPQYTFWGYHTPTLFEEVPQWL